MNLFKTSITLESELVTMIDQIASALGLNRSMFIRMVLKKELVRRGYMDMPLPMTEGMSSKTRKGKNRTEMR